MFNELIRLYDYYQRMMFEYLNSDWDDGDAFCRFCQFDYLSGCVLKQIENY